MKRDVKLSRDALEFIRRSSESDRNLISVIACAKAKRGEVSAAEELYQSGRFRSQLRVAKRFTNESYVLSAKHGVLSLDQNVEPYDVTFPFGIFAENTSIPGIEKLQKGKPIIFFGGNRYLSVLRSEAIPGSNIFAPFENKNTFEAAALVKILENYSARVDCAGNMYEIFEMCARQNGIHSFSKFAETDSIPRQGVYFIFDPREETKFSKILPRIVRIGTHAVSMGSKSTLRTRLRAHFGQGDGTGNHRASIFRLHIGNALIERHQLRGKFPNWGVGMAASPQIRLDERSMEIEVSKYIGGLLFTYMSIGDRASPLSARAVVEKSTINFLTADGVPLEAHSKEWLGASSAVEEIRGMGLWNIQHSGHKFIANGIKAVSRIAHNPTFSEV